MQLRRQFRCGRAPPVTSSPPNQKAGEEPDQSIASPRLPPSVPRTDRVKRLSDDGGIFRPVSFPSSQSDLVRHPPLPSPVSFIQPDQAFAKACCIPGCKGVTKTRTKTTRRTSRSQTGWSLDVRLGPRAPRPWLGHPRPRQAGLRSLFFDKLTSLAVEHNGL